MYIRRFLAISVIDSKSVFDFVTKLGAPTGIDDKRCAIDMAIIRGCLKRMEVTLRWGPTGLMLGDALTKDKAEAADLLRACVRASAYQLADESSTLQRAREEREARSLAIRSHGRRAYCRMWVQLRRSDPETDVIVFQCIECQFAALCFVQQAASLSFAWRQPFMRIAPHLSLCRHLSLPVLHDVMPMFC